MLITASWDKGMRVFDDNDLEEREGALRINISDKHKEAINFVDFQPDEEMTATASDDGYVNLHNHKSRRNDGMIYPKGVQDLAEVKICKFLKGHDVLVTADMDGYLNFYGVFPSSLKNKLLARVNYINIDEQVVIEGPDDAKDPKKASKREKTQNTISFPIRGLDFDPKT